MTIQEQTTKFKLEFSILHPERINKVFAQFAF